MLRILVTVGTRPEIIKLAPVISALQSEPNSFELRVLFSGQHRELTDQMASCMGIEAHWDLRVMQEAQPLAELTARLVNGISSVISEYQPDLVLAQGDTSTTFATALASFYHRTPFIHVEAGLRTQDLYSPFPEEGNRRLISQLTQLHLAPTERDRIALTREGIDPGNVVVTGNTVVDALHKALEQDVELPFSVEPSQKMLLLTLHRRENHGSVLTGILGAVAEVLERRSDVIVVYPVHPNPEVQQEAFAVLGRIEGALLIEPLTYPAFIKAMSQSTLLLSDSGGIQEEAPTLGVPLLVLRENTARLEAHPSLNIHLVGTDPATVRDATLALLDKADSGQPRPAAKNPYGDGRAASRIVAAIKARFLGRPD
jgi:UDP-N-acetylglucosamine 2-epimerase (non-hydrolysing)